MADLKYYHLVTIYLTSKKDFVSHLLIRKPHVNAVLPEGLRGAWNQVAQNPILKAPNTFIIKASEYIWILGQVLHMCVMSKAHLQDTDWMRSCVCVHAPQIICSHTELNMHSKRAWTQGTGHFDFSVIKSHCPWAQDRCCLQNIVSPTMP